MAQVSQRSRADITPPYVRDPGVAVPGDQFDALTRADACADSWALASISCQNLERDVVLRYFDQLFAAQTFEDLDSRLKRVGALCGLIHVTGLKYGAKVLFQWGAFDAGTADYIVLQKVSEYVEYTFDLFDTVFQIAFPESHLPTRLPASPSTVRYPMPQFLPGLAKEQLYDILRQILNAQYKFQWIGVGIYDDDPSATDLYNCANAVVNALGASMDASIDASTDVVRLIDQAIFNGELPYLHQDR